MLTVVRAPAYATVQDTGRRGHLASGVPVAGAMDVASLAALNACLGNDDRAAAIECALSPGEFRFDAGCLFAIGGTRVEAELSARRLELWAVHRAHRGDVLVIGAPANGRFVYLAVAGGIDVQIVLGSRSTYLPARIGGLEGRRLKAGDRLAIGPCAVPEIETFALPSSLRPGGRARIRYVPREEPHLGDGCVISAASDRMGYRLECAASPEGRSITSEPVCPGVIQVPPRNQPIVLMADAPTIGGYRIEGVVISADLSALAQQPPGSMVRFEAVDTAAARAALDDERRRVRENSRVARATSGWRARWRP